MEALSRPTPRTWFVTLLSALRVQLRVAVDFWICGSVAWLGLLALEIDVGRPDAAHLQARLLYMITLACRYSIVLVLPVTALHLLRRLLLRKSRRADLYVSLLLALLLAAPTYRQAELLSSGSLLLDSAHALQIRVLLFALLLGASLMVWQVHLLLVRAVGSGLRQWLSRVVGRRRPALLFVVWLLPSAYVLVRFADAIDQGLRAYLFLSQFLLRSVWLLANSLLFGARLRLLPRAGWLTPMAAGVLALGLLAAAYANTNVRRAKAELERRGGLIALTDLTVSVQRGAPYANLDISQPARFHCPPEETIAEPTTLPTPVRDRRNVILISVDTLRKDALTMRGSDGKLAAETLHAIAEQNVSFERAVTTYPATLFALSSALTGQSPSEVMFSPVPPDNLFTLTKPLLGSPIVALPSASWFKRSPVPQLLTQAATPEFFSNAERSTQWMLERLRLARTQHRRTFAWIHFFEPHTSKVSGRGVAAERSGKQSYAELVRSVDQQIAKLWTALDKLGYLRDSLVIVFSDHGEALGELGYFGHHVYLNQFATDVPLIVHAPGLPARRSERQVLLSDITPTVLQWLGMKPPAGDARSLFAQDDAVGGERYGMSEAFPVRGRALYDVARVPISDVATLTERMRLIRTAAIDYQPKVSLVSSRYRLIVNRVTGAEELYDRKNDPTEERDLSQDGVPAQAEMRQALQKQELGLSERIYCRVRAAENASMKPRSREVP